MIALSGENIRLRAVEPTDLELLYDWENDPENWAVSSTLSPFSRHVLEKYIETARQDIYESKQLRLMIEKKNSREAVGCIDLFDFDPQNLRAGVGILIARHEYRMQGLATESLKLITEYAFSKLHLRQLYCNVFEDNEASLKLFGKRGFLQTGRKTDWIRTENGWRTVVFLQFLNPQS